jgi:hypothetical protein
MDCPPIVAQTVQDILRQGILRARSAGWNGDAARAALEADHIHNLPELLQGYSADLLLYYWKAQRAGFLTEAARLGIATEDFEPLWDRLRPYVPDAPALCKQ